MVRRTIRRRVQDDAIRVRRVEVVAQPSAAR
jgi:hypothetical protein